MPGLKLIHFSKRGTRSYYSAIVTHCGCNFECVILKLVLEIYISSTSCQIALRSVPRKPIDDKSININSGNAFVSSKKPLHGDNMDYFKPFFPVD